jgi:hypothetical protein
MKFAFTIQRNPLGGNDIDVQITAEGDETITTVSVLLDDSELCNVSVDESTTSWERMFLRAGSGSPGMDHVLVATAIKSDGKRASGRREWTDAI